MREQTIADVMAERIVDHLEAVDVDEHDPHQWALTLLMAAPAQRRAQAVHEHRPVGEAGEFVVQHLLRQLPGCIPAEGDVLALHQDLRALGGLLARQVFEHPDLAVLLVVEQAVLDLGLAGRPGHDLVERSQVPGAVGRVGERQQRHADEFFALEARLIAIGLVRSGHDAHLVEFDHTDDVVLEIGVGTVRHRLGVFETPSCLHVVVANEGPQDQDPSESRERAEHTDEERDPADRFAPGHVDDDPTHEVLVAERLRRHEVGRVALVGDLGLDLTGGSEPDELASGRKLVATHDEDDPTLLTPDREVDRDPVVEEEPALVVGEHLLRWVVDRAASVVALVAGIRDRRTELVDGEHLRHLVLVQDDCEGRDGAGHLRVTDRSRQRDITLFTGRSDLGRESEAGILDGTERAGEVGVEACQELPKWLDRGCLGQLALVATCLEVVDQQERTDDQDGERQDGGRHHHQACGAELDSG